MVAAINFYQPGTDPAIDVNQIQRQRDLAAILMKQGMTPSEGQTVSGHYVAPGAGSYIAQLANALAGGFMTRRADENERTLAQTLATNRAKDAAGIMDAMSGTPAVPSRTVNPATPNDDEGNPMPTVQTDAIPAKGPDMSKALAIALQSQDPTFRGMAPDMMKRQMDAAEFQAAMSAARTGSAPAAPASGAGPDAGGASPSGGALPPGPNADTFGLDPAAFALASSKNAQAQAIAKMIQENNKPMTLAPGGTAYVPGRGPMYTAPMAEPGIQVTNKPDGTQTATQVGNYAETKAAQEAAIARAKADQELKTLNVNGVDVTKTVGQWRAELGGGSGPVPTPRPTPPAAPPQPTRGGSTMLDNTGGVVSPTLPVTGTFALGANGRVDEARAQASIDALSPGPARDQVQRALQQQLTQQALSAPAPNATPGGGIQGQNANAKTFGDTIAQESGKQLLEGRTKAQTALNDLASIAESRKAIQAGTYQGTGANWKLDAANFIQSNLGAKVDPEKVGNTGYLQSTLGATLLGQAKSLGTNPTDADARRLEAILGTVGTDPKAMDKILDWREEMATRAINGHNATVTDAEKRGMTSPYDLRVKIPSAAPSGQSPAPANAPQAMDIRSLAAQELQRRRGK